MARTTAYDPWSNGETERRNKTLMLLLKCMVEENPKKWDILLQKAPMHYRSSVRVSIRFTPCSAETCDSRGQDWDPVKPV